MLHRIFDLVLYISKTIIYAHRCRHTFMIHIQQKIVVVTGSFTPDFYFVPSSFHLFCLLKYWIMHPAHPKDINISPVKAQCSS